MGPKKAGAAPPGPPPAAPPAAGASASVSAGPPDSVPVAAPEPSVQGGDAEPVAGECRCPTPPSRKHGRVI